MKWALVWSQKTNLLKLAVLLRSVHEVVDFADDCDPELTHIEMERVHFRIRFQYQSDDLLKGDALHRAKRNTGHDHEA